MGNKAPEPEKKQPEPEKKQSESKLDTSLNQTRSSMIETDKKNVVERNPQEFIKPIPVETIPEDEIFYFYNNSREPWNEYCEISWSEFSRSESKTLEEKYQKFLKKEIKEYEMDNYKYSFLEWVRTSNRDQTNQTQFKRDYKSNLAMVYRNQKVLQNEKAKPSQPILKIDESGEEKFREFKIALQLGEDEEFSIVKFQEPNLVEFKLKNDFCFLGTHYNLSFSLTVKALRDEISNIHLYLKEKVLDSYTTLLNNMTDSTFYQDIVKIFTQKGIMIDFVNQALTTRNIFEVNLIKYFFYCLKASITYLSKPNNNQIIVYVGAEWEAKSLENLEKGNMFVNMEFYFATKSKDKAISLMNKKNKGEKVLLEITIPSQAEVADIKKFSASPDEQEVVINFGQVLVITEFSKDKYYNLKCSLLGSNIKSLLQLSKEKNYDAIDLSDMNLEKSEQMKDISSIKDNSDLQSLYLGNNKFGSSVENMKILKDSTLSCKNMKKLYLNDNNLGSNPSNCEILAQLLSSHQGLTEVYLGYNNLGQNAMNMEKLSIGLKSCVNLQWLHLNNNQLGTNVSDSKFLCVALEKHNKIEFLMLEENELGSNPDNMKNIALLLKSNSSIKELLLCQNNLGNNIENIKNLKEGLKLSTSLEVLHLNENLLGTNVDNIKLICESIGESKKIQELYISFNDFGVNTQNVETLCKMLESNTKIQKLFLGESKLGENIDNVTNVAKLIKNSKNITTLYLGYNNLGCKREYMKILAESLKQNKILKELFLCSNEFEESDLKVLSESLGINTTLEKIYYEDNGIEEEQITKVDKRLTAK